MILLSYQKKDHYVNSSQLFSIGCKMFLIALYFTCLLLRNAAMQFKKVKIYDKSSYFSLQSKKSGGVQQKTVN
ncbi:MAG: hypothetical protein DI539_05620 [Flavobacterium psychrophilum]|nr:MAG: hypothetical protein DI539_05620 [Flavobacterium psychrophilum]